MTVSTTWKCTYSTPAPKPPNFPCLRLDNMHSLLSARLHSRQRWLRDGLLLMDSELLYTKTRSVSLNRHTIFVSLVTNSCYGDLKITEGRGWSRVA